MTEVHISKISKYGITTLFIACTRNHARNTVHYISNIPKYGITTQLVRTRKCGIIIHVTSSV